jgi:hypothetical protein
MTKYYIASKDISRGVIGDDDPANKRYYELGWELAITRMYINFLIDKGEIDVNNDFIVTNEDRKFLYTKYCKNVISYKDFVLNKVEDSQVIDLPEIDMSISFEILHGNMESYKDEILKNKLNLEIDIKNSKEILKNNKDFVCMVVRKRDHAPNRSVNDLDVNKIINFYIQNEKDVYIMGKDCEFYDNGKDTFHVSYQEFSSLINDDNCINMITPLSGGGMIRFYTGTCPLTVIDMTREYNPSHTLYYGDGVDLIKLKEKGLFSLFWSAEDIIR